MNIFKGCTYFWMATYSYFWLHTYIVKITCYNRSSLTNRDITKRHANSQKQIQNSSGDVSYTSNGEYKNFVTTHIEAAAEYIPTKLKAKCQVHWESLVVSQKKKKQDNL